MNEEYEARYAREVARKQAVSEQVLRDKDRRARHHAARLSKAAHASQVLVSQAVSPVAVSGQVANAVGAKTG